MWIMWHTTNLDSNHDGIYASEALQEIPSVISHEDREILSYTNDLSVNVTLYEELLEKYPEDAHPYFLVRKANLLLLFRGDAIPVALYRKAQAILVRLNAVDEELDVFLQMTAERTDRQANAVLEMSNEDHGNGAEAHVHGKRGRRDHTARRVAAAEPEPVPAGGRPDWLTPLDPVLLFVVVDGVPSNATWAIVGSGRIEWQPTTEASVLPPSVRQDRVTGSGGGAGAGGKVNANSMDRTDGKEESNLPVIIGCIVSGVMVVGVLGALIALCMKCRNQSAPRMPPFKEYGVSMDVAGAGAGLGGKPVVSGWSTSHDGDSSVFAPLAKGGGAAGGQYHNARTGSMSINAPYKDEGASGRGTSSFGSRSQVLGNDAYDAYSGQPPVAHACSAMGEDATSTTQLNQYQYHQQRGCR
ncbi:hypothetical protein CVT25_006556 [Psilocybe cyanescens]|uniref:Uncharacterized protein n=1 Tax=Psilocybe cyanescens TaxID=93625 RepID=A0A409W266_PSICY|nr:hypothetical protein CVT25_006556 [Psilocybe cyanescens]